MQNGVYINELDSNIVIVEKHGTTVFIDFGDDTLILNKSLANFYSSLFNNSFKYLSEL